MSAPAIERAPLFLDVRDLRLVDAVARCGSLARASGELHLTESALSHQLASLERRVGTRVFERRSRRMIVTAAGERLRATARQVLAALVRTEDDLRRPERTAAAIARIRVATSRLRWCARASASRRSRVRSARVSTDLTAARSQGANTPAERARECAARSAG